MGDPGGLRPTLRGGAAKNRAPGGQGWGSGDGAVAVGDVGGGVGSGEGLGAGELLFGFGLAAETVVEPAEEEGWGLGVRGEMGGEEHFVGGLLGAAEFFEAEGELLMGEGVVA